MQTITVSDKTSIINALNTTSERIAHDIASMSDDQFNAGTDTSWAASGYLKHLILSVKPMVKGMQLPREQMQAMFGTAENGSMTFEQLVDTYNAAMAAGQQATGNVVPVAYRMPDNITDEKAYLIETWEDASQRLITELENWSEDELDTTNLPHPAIGNITVREMLFFTVHHNRLHHQDMLDASGLA